MGSGDSREKGQGGGLIGSCLSATADDDDKMRDGN
jgi:hypothetical protein